MWFASLHNGKCSGLGTSVSGALCLWGPRRWLVQMQRPPPSAGPRRGGSSLCGGDVGGRGCRGAVSGCDRGQEGGRPCRWSVGGGSLCSASVSSLIHVVSDPQGGSCVGNPWGPTEPLPKSTVALEPVWAILPVAPAPAPRNRRKPPQDGSRRAYDQRGQGVGLPSMWAMQDPGLCQP